MKLPDIEYGAPVQDPGVGALRQVDAAQRQAAATISAGFQAFGQELVKTQTHKAAAELADGLARLEEDLKRQPSVSAQWVREQLGDQADSLLQSAGVREQLTRRTVDPATGETVEVERTEIPTWVVAGAIYEKRSKDLLRNTSASISVGQGWQAAYQEAAGPDVAQARAKFAAGQSKLAKESLQAEQGATLDTLVRLGHFGRAVALVEDSRAFDVGEKAALKEKILHQEQEFAWKDDAQQLARAAVAGSLFPGSDRVNPNAAQDALDAKLEGKPPAFRLLARAELDGAIRFHNSGQVEQLGHMAGQALQAFQAPGPDGKPRFSTAAIPTTLRAWFTSPTGGRERAEYWRTLLSWEASKQASDRGDRQLPTDEQSRNYLHLVTDMREHPATYRAMTSSQLADLWMRTKEGQSEPPLSLRDWSTVVDLFARTKDPAAPVSAGRHDGLVARWALATGLLPKDGKGKPAAASAEQTEAVREVGRRVQSFVEEEVRKTRKEPDGSVIDGFIQDQLQTQEVQHLFGLWTTRKVVPTPEAVTTRATEPGQPVRPVAPERRAAPAVGSRIPGELVGQPKGTVFEVQANGRLKRVK